MKYKNIEGKFSNDFVKDSLKDNYKRNVLHCLKSGEDPYRMIETILKTMDEMQKGYKNMLEEKPILYSIPDDTVYECLAKINNLEKVDASDFFENENGKPYRLTPLGFIEV